MAASVDTPKRRSLRLLAEGGSAEVSPALVTPDARAPGPRTRISEENRSLVSSHRSGNRSPRRVSDGAGGQETTTRRRIWGHLEDGPPGEKGPSTIPSSDAQGPQTEPSCRAQGPQTAEPSSRAQGPLTEPSSEDTGPARGRRSTEIGAQSPPAAGENPTHRVDAKPWRSRRGSQVNGGESRGDVGSPRSGLVLQKATPSTVAKGIDPVGPGPSPMAKRTDHVGPGPSPVAKRTDHVGPGPSPVAKRTDHVGPGPSPVVKRTDHVGPGPSPVAKRTDHVGPGPSPVSKRTDHMGHGPYTVTKRTDHVGPGPSPVTKRTDHVGPGPSPVTKRTDHVGPGPYTVAKRTDHVGPGPSPVTKRTDHVGPGPSPVTKRTDHVGPGPSPVTKRTDHVGPGPSPVAKGPDHVGTGPSSTTKGACPSMVPKEKDHEGPGPSSVANEMPVTRSRSSMGSTDLEKAGPSCVRKSKKASPPKPNAARDHNKTGLLKANESDHGSPVKHGKPPPAGAKPCAAFPRDHKVHCYSKKLLQDVLAKCTEIGKQVLESQQQLSPDRRQLELRNFVWDFETAFQENISINGQSWHEAPDSDGESAIKILEDQLDDAIIDTAVKRRRYPNKVKRHFVRELKAERELLDHYKPVVKPQELKLDVSHEFSRMCLIEKADIVFQQINETMKALPVQLEKAEGFSQVLSLQPALEACHLRRNIFSSRVVLEDVAKTQPKGLETTPTDNEPQTKAAPALKLKRQLNLSTPNSLYPLRSKRKISLET
ncbi:kinetochore-associated protein NSL1 homolog [Pseudophryne corroboree]|uniref:kinetochore-associated protein NSL1 homolog n=1 Tax=Pseudophryne corroboree TaxID=495146 RepID=UPI00308198D3